MRIPFRQFIFWPHLVMGVCAGLVIAVMCLTGVALALEEHVVNWVDAEAQRVPVPAPGTPRLTVDELLARVRAARPETPPSALTEYPEPDAAVRVALGRSGGVYVNPYSGEVRDQGAAGWRAFFHTMEEAHRWLALQGEHRAAGRALTGVSNLLFLLLGVSGLYLWWPRKWTWRTVRPTFWFKGGLRGKARDFNWHNVTGFWMLPVLIVLTATGVVMSSKWASDLVFTLTGNEPPVTQGPFATAPVTVPTPPEGARPLGLEPLFAEARKQVPAWESLTLRLGGPRGGGNERGGGERGGPSGPQALTLSIKGRGSWPLFAAQQVAFDPFTARVLHRESFADYNAGRRLRTWIRFLHTGEALGVVGQFLAALASVGGGLLVLTGYTLAWRRLIPRRKAPAPASPSTPSA